MRITLPLIAALTLALGTSAPRAEDKPFACAAVPAPVVALNFGSRYTDDSKTRSDIDEVSNAEVDRALRPVEQFIGDLHKQANDVARESLALDALARELKIEVTEDDINAEFEKAGVKDVEASKAEFIADGRMPAVRESIRRSKAVDHLVENAKVTEVDETAKDAE